MSRKSELLGQLEELRLEMGAKLESEKAARKAAEAVETKAIDWRSEPALQHPRVQGQQVEHSYRSHTDTSLFMSQSGMQVAKIIDGQTLHLWPSRFQAVLTARGLISTLGPASDPIWVVGVLRDMADRDRLVYRHGPEKVEKYEKAWEFLMEAMQGQPVEERKHATGSVEGAWKAVMD